MIYILQGLDEHQNSGFMSRISDVEKSLRVPRGGKILIQVGDHCQLRIPKPS